MEPANNYGKLSRAQLITELAEVTGTLVARVRELGGMRQDFNNEWYPEYARAESNSVAAKERMANYRCLELLNDIGILEQEIRYLSELKSTLIVVLKYATS